jgi:hypothetical protein
MFALKGRGFQPRRKRCPVFGGGITVCGKTCFWVAQRFQRCDKVSL